MASVQGTYPDQSWAHSLPGYFKDNVKPSLNERAFLIPRDNVAIPNIVSKSTVGMVNDRGFIDEAPGRMNTIRHFITNPSTYVTRLHPHDLTAGTGGIDNLSNLYRFGHPTPFSNAIDFADVEYYASRELASERLDPLSNGYAAKVLGPEGQELQTRMRADQMVAGIRERYRTNMYTEEANRVEEQNRGYNEANALVDRASQSERRAAAMQAAETQTQNEAANDDPDVVVDVEDVDDNDEEEVQPDPVPGEVTPDEEAVGDERAAENRLLSAAQSPTATPGPTNLGEDQLLRQSEVYDTNLRRFMSPADRYRDSLQQRYSNTPYTAFATTQSPFASGNTSGVSRLAGTNQNFDNRDANAQLTDAQLRAFQRRSDARVWFNPVENADVAAEAVQGNNLIASRNQNHNDGNFETPYDQVRAGDSSQAPQTLWQTARTGRGVSASLTGDVSNPTRSPSAATTTANRNLDATFRQVGAAPSPNAGSRTERRNARTERRNARSLVGAIRQGNVQVRRGQR